VTAILPSWLAYSVPDCEPVCMASLEIAWLADCEDENDARAE
jgi:hypothetical protein